MKLSDAGLAFIASFEGYHTKLPDGSCKAYRCQLGNGRDDGVWTIGFGCTVGVYEGLIWTRAQADEAFRRELAKFESAVNRLATVDLNQNQFDALVSFAYNVGEGALKGSTLLKKVNSGDQEGAARQFGQWVNSNGVKRVPGLVRRRAAEAELFQRLVIPAADPEMPRTVDPPSPVPEGSRTVATANAGQTGAAAAAVGGIGLSLADGLNYSDKILPMVKSYGLHAFILCMLILAAGFAIVKHFRVEDHVEGRNIQ